jgi:hypothetical protein
MMNKKIDDQQLAALEKERNEVLARVVKRVKESQNLKNGEASHASHSSGGGRTHQSYVSA